MASTTATRLIRARRPDVYEALLNTTILAQWKVPYDMTMQVLAYNEDGSFRISLSYTSAGQIGKSSEHTDTYRGRFTELVPHERIVEEDEFETTDPALRGTMTITYGLRDADGATELTVVHDGLPDGVPVADNENGWSQALDRLAALLESG